MCDAREYAFLIEQVENITTITQLKSYYAVIVEYFKGGKKDALQFLAANLKGLDLESTIEFFSTTPVEKSVQCHLAMKAALHRGNETLFLEWEKICLNSLRIPDVKVTPSQLRPRSSPPKPTASILCAVYNHEYFIDRMVSSLVSQSFDDIEILILDDCSSDSSLERLRIWQRRLPGVIKIVSMRENIVSQNKSPMELLIRLCSGRFIAFCDGDDFWVDQDRLQRQIHFLEQRQDLVSCSYNMIYWDTVEGVSNLASPANYARIDYADNLKKVSNLLWINTLVMRSVFNRTPDESLLTHARDVVFTSYLGHFGGNIHHGDHIGAVQRRTKTSFWNPRSESEKNAERFTSRHAIKMLLGRTGNNHLLDYCDYRIDRLGIGQDEAENLRSIMMHRIAEGVDSLRIDESEYELVGF